jgi:hypothetical protein
MKLKLVAAISALAIPALAHAQQSGPQPNAQKPTKADAQNVVQIITSDKVKTQSYCDFTKLEGQVKAAEQKNDTKTLEALSRQAESRPNHSRNRRAFRVAHLRLQGMWSRIYGKRRTGRVARS